MKLDTKKSRMSYALAINLAESIRNMPADLDYAIVGEAFDKLVNGGKPELPPAEYSDLMQELQRTLRDAVKRHNTAVAAKCREAEEKFLAENARKEGVVTTKSGLQYQILRNGSGRKPTRDDVVSVHYEGRLLNGNVFDSSVARGEPAEFPLGQVIAGWTEGLQLMSVGAKHRLFIPAALAYGEHGAGDAVPPHSTLIFDVELLDIK